MRRVGKGGPEGHETGTEPYVRMFKSDSDKRYRQDTPDVSDDNPGST